MSASVCRKHVRMLWRYWVLTFRNFREFTWDAWLAAVQFAFYMGRALVFWWAISSAAGEYAGWTLPELSLFTAVSFLPGLHQLVWNFWNRASFSDKVLRGDLDKYFARPVHPLFALAAEDVHVALFLRYFVPSLTMALVVIRRYRLPVTIMSFACGYLLLSLAKLVLTMMRTAASMAAFRHGDVSGVHSMFFSFTSLGGYPVTAYPGWLKFVLEFILPAAFTATYPTLLMLGKTSGLGLFIVLTGLGLIWGLIMLRAWDVTARQYESPGG